MLGVAGCAQPTPPPVAHAPTAKAETPVRRPTRLTPAPVAAPRPPAPVEMPLPAPAAVQVAPAAPVADPVGMSEAEVAKLFGPPDHTAVQDPSHVWTYAVAACTLRVTFFLDVNRNAYFALDRTIAGTDGSDAAAQGCLQRIAARARPA